MGIIDSIKQWLKTKPKQGYLQSEHYNRFVKPHYERGIQAGMTIEQLDRMLSEAWSQANPPHINPGGLFRDMVDNWIADNP